MVTLAASWLPLLVMVMGYCRLLVDVLVDGAPLLALTAGAAFTCVLIVLLLKAVKLPPLTAAVFESSSSPALAG